MVVGGGITGISAAYHATQAGYKTVLVEAESIGSGSAGKNGGMVVEGFPIDFKTAVGRFGEAVAKEAWQRTIEAREHVASLIKKHSIECDLSMAGSLYVGTTDSDVAFLEAELEARISSGLSGEMTNTEGPKGTALYVAGDLLLHPVKFVRALASEAERQGLLIFENTSAVFYDAHTVTTPRGTIRAKHVIVATETWKSDLSPTEGDIRRELALVTEPLGDDAFTSLTWNQGGMFWTTDLNYIAVRRIGTRLFLNAGIEISPDNEQIKSDEEKLITDVVAYFPTLHRGMISISHKWTGLLLYPSRSLPFITTDSGHIELYGNGGNGLTNGIMLGKIAAEYLQGGDIPELYR